MILIGEGEVFTDQQESPFSVKALILTVVFAVS